MVTSILPAGRVENIIRGTPNFNMIEGFGTPLLFWLVESVWMLRATTAIRANPMATRQVLIVTAIVVALGTTIFTVAFVWWLLLASGTTR